MTEQPGGGAHRLQAGGTLDPERHVYIRRPEDDQLFELLRDGQYANVLTSRQTGKSSLVMSSIYRLRALGTRTTYVDLTSIGTPEKIDDFYLGLLDKVVRDLKLEVELRNWWRRQAGETINQRLMRFFREVVASADVAPVVVFLDEIDSTLKLPYTDDLFTALRAMYNERALEPAYERITICLVGVATPDELVRDRRTTAYNVGQTLELHDFDAGRDDLGSLARALSDDLKAGEAMLARVLHWTGGHPYLTLRATQRMIERGASTTVDVDRLIEDVFRSLESLSNDSHVRQILKYVETRLSQGLDSLSLYQRLLDGNRERDTPTLTHAELKLSGLVKRDADGLLVVRNPIYRRLFDRQWVESSKPRREYQARHWAVATALLLLTLASGGGYYYGIIILPEQQRLAALDQLRDFGAITVADDLPGNVVTFREQALQTSLEQAVPLFWAVEPIVEVNLSGTSVSDVSALTGLANLQSLVLSGTSVSDVSALTGLANLRSLVLSGTSVSDVSALSRLANMEVLDLSGTSVNDLSALSGLVSLESLVLSGTSVSDLSALWGLANLRSLVLSGTSVSDVSALSRLANLQWLDLSGTSVPAEAVRVLREALAANGNESVEIIGP